MMVTFLGYLLAILVGVVFPLFLVFFVLASFVTDFMGAPYVPTSGKLIDEILKKAKLKKGQQFIELGSGDGRIVRRAVEKFGVRGTGVELNPYLIFYSRFLAKREKEDIKFLSQDFFKTDLSKADVIFIFLLPRTIEKLKKKFISDCKKNTLIISHGFRVKGFEERLVSKLEGNPFPTYYYILS